MNCPFCSQENTTGVDQCARCGADLTNLDDRENAHDIEKDLLQRPLGHLTADDYLELSPETPVGETIRRLNEGGYHCAIVVSEGHIVGIFTERDILNKLADRMDDCADAPISEYMTSNPEVLRKQDPMAFGLNRMMVPGFRHIPIEEDGTLAGVVSVRDILGYMVDQFHDVITASPPGEGGAGGG